MRPGTDYRLRPLRAELLRMHEDDPQWPHYLGLELAVQRLPLDDRQQLPILAFFREGANRLALDELTRQRLLATLNSAESGEKRERLTPPKNYEMPKDYAPKTDGPGMLDESYGLKK